MPVRSESATSVMTGRRVERSAFANHTKRIAHPQVNELRPLTMRGQGRCLRILFDGGHGDASPGQQARDDPGGALVLAGQRKPSTIVRLKDDNSRQGPVPPALTGMPPRPVAHGRTIPWTKPRTSLDSIGDVTAYGRTPGWRDESV